jgi:hypothetical protein
MVALHLEGSNAAFVCVILLDYMQILRLNLGPLTCCSDIFHGDPRFFFFLWVSKPFQANVFVAPKKSIHRGLLSNIVR